MGNKTKDLVFHLILTALLTNTTACSDGDSSSHDTDTIPRDTQSETGDSDSHTDIDTDSNSAVTDTESAQPSCPTYSWVDSFTVDPINGINADIDSLCISAAIPVSASSDAVNIQLNAVPGNWETVEGLLQFPEGLAEHIVGTPTISIDTAWPSELANGTVSNVQQTDDGITFGITFPDMTNVTESLPVQPYGRTFIYLLVAFELDCASTGMNTTLAVEAQVPFYFCGTSDNTYAWSGPEDECTVCGPVVSEVSAIPVPAEVNDEGVLSGPMQATLLPIGETADAVLLWAQCRTADEPTYHWRASNGTVIHRHGNLAIYRKSQNQNQSQLIQVAAVDKVNVAVATYRTKGS